MCDSVRRNCGGTIYIATCFVFTISFVGCSYEEFFCRIPGFSIGRALYNRDGEGRTVEGYGEESKETRRVERVERDAEKGQQIVYPLSSSRSRTFVGSRFCICGGAGCTRVASLHQATGGGVTVGTVHGP